MAQQETTPLVASKYFKTVAITVSPNSEYEINIHRGYYLMYTYVNPPWGLGFLKVSVDNGPFIPITLLPYYDTGGFQYITVYNTHPNTSFTVELVVSLTSKIQLLGTYSPTYTAFNQELIIQESISGTGNQNIGPFYIGIRSIVTIAITNVSITAQSGYLGQLQVTLYNSDQSGNQYNNFVLGVIQQPLNSSALYGPQSIVASIDGSLLNPYILLSIMISSVTTSYSFALTITAR